jgi:hypothetical protein
MDHMIVPDGPFDRTVRKLLARGLVISWIEQPARTAASGDDAGDDEESKNKSGKRVRYVCPHGDMKAWAKHGAKLVCGEHMEPMDVHQPTPRDYRGITPTSEDPASEEDA